MHLYSEVQDEDHKDWNMDWLHNGLIVILPIYLWFIVIMVYNDDDDNG